MSLKLPPHSVRNQRYIPITHYLADKTPLVTYLSQTEAARTLFISWKAVSVLRKTGMLSLRDGSYLKVSDTKI